MAGEFILDGNTFRYWDEGGSIKFGVASNLENTRLDTTYKLDSNWASRATALTSLRGTLAYAHVGDLPVGLAVYSSSGKGYIRRILPHQSIENGAKWLYCTQASYRGHVARENLVELNLPGAAEAIIDATYEGQPYNHALDAAMARGSDGVAWPVDESWFVGGEFKRYVSMPTPKEKTRVEWGKAGTWKWVDTDRIATMGKPILYKNLEYVITWHQVPVANIPWNSITYLTGKCNEARFAVFSSESLVFDSPSFTGHRNIDGQRICDINYTFTWHNNGANFFPDPERGFRFFELIASDLSGRKPYPPGNFRMLFRPEPAISD